MRGFGFAGAKSRSQGTPCAAATGRQGDGCESAPDIDRKSGDEVCQVA